MKAKPIIKTKNMRVRKKPWPDPIVGKSSPPVVSSNPVEEKVKVREERISGVPSLRIMPLQEETGYLKDTFASQLARVSELRTRAELGGNRNLLKGYHGQELKAYNPHLQPGTESILGTGSSVETLINNLKSRTSAAPQSTVPTSLFDASSKGSKNIFMQGFSVERTNLPATTEVSYRVTTQHTDWDDQSSISSVTMLGPKQKKDIVCFENPAI
jgi:hypothetical protein